MSVTHRRHPWEWWRLYGDGITDPADPRLVSVPSVPGRQCRLHWAAAAVFRALADAWQELYPKSPGLLATSGWRQRQPWQRSEPAYRAELLRRYRPRMADDATDEEVIRHGRVYLAYRSAHFTGLAVDLGSPPPMRASSLPQHVERMRQSNAYQWLMETGLGRGLRNYIAEPWHWELPLSVEAWEAPGPEAPA